MKDGLKRTDKHQLVLVTAPGLKEARVIAQAVLNARLAACVNLVPQIESHYWWQGKLEKGREVLMVIKTARGLVRRLAEEVRAHHPYDSPEFVALGIHSGSASYLDWLDRSVANG